MRRREMLAHGAAAAVALGAATRAVPAAAQRRMVMKASDVHPEGYPTVQAVESMGKKLEEATGGRLSVRMYASSQLGGEKEAVEQAQVGALQIARVSVGVLGSVVDELNVFNMPFLFRDPAHMDKVIDGPIGQELLDKVTNHPDAKLIGLCFMDAGARSFYDAKRPIRTVADLKGLKVRVIGNPIFVDMANALGANAISMGYDQVFSALQTGVVDGAENNTPSFVFDNHYQVAKHYGMTEHLIVPEMAVFSKASWNTLSAEDQALVKKLGQEMQAEERTFWQKTEQDALARMKAANIEITPIADKTPFREAVKPVYDKYGAKYKDLIERIGAVT